MVRLSKLSINDPIVKNLEIIVTVIYLLYFLDIQFPSSLSSIFNALSYPITAIFIVLHWKNIAYVSTRNIPLLIFLGIAMFSFVWSTNLSHTFDGSRGLFRAFLFGAYFATRYSLKEQIKILIYTFGLVAILSALLCLFLPQYGFAYQGWGGIFPYKNLLGRAMILVSILLLITTFLNNFKNNWLYWAIFVIAISLILISNSSMSLLLLLSMLPQIFVYFIVQQRYRTRLINVSFISIFLFCIIAFIVSNLETILVDILGEGMTFNGRTPIWTLIIEKVLNEKPILGYGYQAFWSSDAGAYVIMHTWASLNALPIPTTFNAHNAYLEIFASLGFLGLFSYGIVLVNAVYKIVILLFSTRKIEFFWLFEFLIFIGLASLADVGIGLGNTSTYGILSIAGFLSISLEYERFKKKRNSLMTTYIS